MKKDCKRMF